MTDSCKIFLAREGAWLPERKTAGAVGYDLYAVEDIKLLAYALPTLVDTGVVVIPPAGFHTEVLLRSSLGTKGVCLANSIGLIDQDYCGPTDTIKLALRYLPDLESCFTSRFGQWINTSGYHQIKAGDRIGQLVFRRTYTPELELVDSVEQVSRGGFGSTN